VESFEEDAMTGSTQTPQPLPARSVDEIHLYLDIQGMPREGRSQRLESWGDELVSIYTGVVDGREVEIPFVAPEDRLAEGFGIE
jgi:hypothetical protein